MKAFVRLLLVPIILGITLVGSLAFDVPALTSRVNDYAMLLTQPQKDNLESTLRALENATTVQVAILTVKDLQGEDIESFSVKVANSWALGQKGKDNGALLLYAVQQDKYRIEVGRGLEGAIPDGKAGEIIRQQLRGHANPKKGTSDFGAAFEGAVHQISAIVTAEYAQDPTGASMRKHVSSTPDSDTIMGILFVCVIVAGVFGAMNLAAGATVGALEGAAIAWYLALGTAGFLGLIVLGLLVGSVARFILEAGLAGGGGGFGGSSSDSGGFSGGGGSFGGGGASG